MVSKVNFKKRAESKREVFVILFLILSFGLLVGILTTLKPSQAEKKVDTENHTLAQTSEVDLNATLTNSPTGTLSPFLESISATPAPSLTATSQPGQVQEQVEQAFSEIATAVSYYPGPPLPPPSEKKELLIISDSLPQEPWKVEKQDFEWVPGKLGRGIKPGEQGLLLSGGEVSAALGTISFWLKIETESVADEATVMDWNFGGENEITESLFEISSSGDWLLFSTYIALAIQNDISSELGSAFSWHHVVATWDFTQKPFKKVLYIDAKKVSEDNLIFPPSIRNPSVFQIGGNIGSGRMPIPFVVDEIILSNWAKSEEEIVEND